MLHAPVLEVVVPLLAAPICLLLRRSTWASWFAALATTATAALAWYLLAHVVHHGAWDYAIGGWQPPLGIAYRIDLLSALMCVMVSSIAAIVALWAPHTLADELAERQIYLFWTAYLLCLAGLLGMCVTADAFNAFVFLEISSLASYVLIGLGPDRRALLAAFRYLVLGSVGGTFVLIGVGLLYQVTGTLNMADIAARLPSVLGSRTTLVSLAFIAVGTSLKFALWPLHGWLPAAYAYAPRAVSAFIASSGTKVMLFLLIRFVYSVYDDSWVFGQLALGLPLRWLGAAGVVVASVAAIQQRDLRRVLALSSVAQVGYIVIGIALASTAGLTAAMLHLLQHGLVKGAMFMALGTLTWRVGGADLDDLRGVGRRMPWTFGAWLVGGLGLIGIPGTMGFVSKVALLMALIDAGAWPLVVLVLATSLLALMYVWRLVEVLWLSEPSGPALAATPAPFGLALPAWLLAGVTLVFGFAGSSVWSFVFDAAKAVTGGR